MAELIIDGQLQIEPGILTGHVLMPDIAYVVCKTKRAGKGAPVDGPFMELTCPIPLELCPHLDNIAWMTPNGKTVKRLVVLIEFEPGILKLPEIEAEK